MNFRLKTGLAITIAILAACDAAGPEDRALDIAISVETSTPSIHVDPAGVYQITCSVTLTASATGAAGVTATWHGGERRWYVGVDRTVPVAVETLTPADVVDFWKVVQLAAGESVTTYWNFWAEVPFVIEHQFHFTTGADGRMRNTSTASECGLDISPEAVPPPVISDLVIDAPAPFQPGDTYTVSFTAAATGGLWQSRVMVNGAYQAVEEHSEQLVRESRRSFGFRVPPGIVLGMPIEVSVRAVDAFGQTSQTVSTQSAPLVDETPPYYLRVSTGFALEPGVEAWMVGQFAAGDTIPLLVATADNQELGELILDIRDERRVIALDGHYLLAEVPVEIATGWIGSTGLSVQVTDAQGLEGPRHQSHPDSIRVYPVNPRPTISWSNSGSFSDAAWDETRERAYVTVAGVAEVVVVSTATLSVERRIALPAVPGGLDFTPGGDTLVVTLPLSRSIAIVDLANDQVTELPLLPAGLSNPHYVAVMSGARALVGVTTEAGTVEIAHIDLPDGSITARTAAGAWSPTSMRLTRSADRSVAGVPSNDGCLIIYSTATDSFGGCIATGAQWYSISADPAGTRFLSAQTVIDVASGTVHNPTWGLSLWTSHVGALAADGQSFFLSDMKGLMRLRTSDGVVLERIPYPRLYGRIIPAADGSRLLTLSNDPDAWPEQFTVGLITLQ